MRMLTVSAIAKTGFLWFWIGGIALSQNSSPAPITLEGAIQIAKVKNPTLLAAQRNVDATRAEEITAGLRQNPELTFGGSNVSLPAVGASNPYQYSVGVSRLFERGDKRKWRLEAARATTQEAASQYRDTARQTILSIKQAFTNTLLAKAVMKLSLENLQGYQKTVDASRIRWEAGDLSKTDYLRIDLQLAQFESDYETAKLNLTQASDQLQLLLGYEHPQPGFDVVGSLIPPPRTLTLFEAEQRGLDSRPDYLAAKAALATAEANAKLAIANGTTDPTLSGEYDRSGTFDSAGFGVNIPLRVFDRNQGEKRVTRFQVDAAHFSEAALRNQVIFDVQQAWASYQSALAQATRYNGHYLQEADQVRTNLEFSFRNGGTTLLDYLSALQEFRQTSLNSLNWNAQVWLAIHQLSAAEGTDF